MLKDKSVSLQSFEWQTALKYRVNYMALLRAETEQELIPSLDPINNGTQMFFLIHFLKIICNKC